MNVKNVWKATWFSFIVGFILVTFVALCLLLITNDINSSDDLYNVLFVLMVMGVVYSIVQFSFSFLLNAFLVDRELTPKEVLGIALKIMLFLYTFVPALLQTALQRLLLISRKNFERVRGFFAIFGIFLRMRYYVFDSSYSYCTTASRVYCEAMSIQIVLRKRS